MLSQAVASGNDAGASPSGDAGVTVTVTEVWELEQKREMKATMKVMYICW